MANIVINNVLSETYLYVTPEGGDEEVMEPKTARGVALGNYALRSPGKFILTNNGNEYRPAQFDDNGEMVMLGTPADPWLKIVKGGMEMLLPANKSVELLPGSYTVEVV